MCLICKDWEMEKMTSKEALRNIGEAIGASKSREDSKHLLDLADRIMDKEVPMKEPDPDTDGDWEKSHRE